MAAPTGTQNQGTAGELRPPRWQDWKLAGIIFAFIGGADYALVSFGTVGHAVAGGVGIGGLAAVTVWGATVLHRRRSAPGSRVLLLAPVTFRRVYVVAAFAGGLATVADPVVVFAGAFVGLWAVALLVGVLRDAHGGRAAPGGNA